MYLNVFYQITRYNIEGDSLQIRCVILIYFLLVTQILPFLFDQTPYQIHLSVVNLPFPISLKVIIYQHSTAQHYYMPQQTWHLSTTSHACETKPQFKFELLTDITFQTIELAMRNGVHVSMWSSSNIVRKVLTMFDLYSIL